MLSRKPVAALGAAAAIALLAPAAASANAVVDWSRHADQALAEAGRSTGAASPVKAIVQGAVYDAVNAIAGTHEPYLDAPPARRWYSRDAAAATAAYGTLIGLVPDQQPMLRPLYEQSLAAIPDGAAERGGVRVGTEAAETMLAARANDGRDGSSVVVIGTEPGEWRPTPPAFATDPASWLANVTPFLIPSAEALRSPGPNPLTSSAYARDFVEIKAVGSAGSRTRTEEQTDVALYWDQAPWYEIAEDLTASQRLSTAETARLFAMVGLTGADAAIACHDDKYHWTWWRPITAIREAAGDGNPLTRPDTDWEPLIDTPPTPEHPSGHACVSAGVVGALQAFFGTDAMTFSATSRSSGTMRGFTSFSQALDEVIDARVWSGIHFRTADLQGAEMGDEVARWMRRHTFEEATR